MITKLRHKYWIMKTPRLCRDIRSACVVCKRHEAPLSFIPKYFNLPPDRVNLSRPFAAMWSGPLWTIQGQRLIKLAKLTFYCLSAQPPELFVIS
jgi:hypothetical protein